MGFFKSSPQDKANSLYQQAMQAQQNNNLPKAIDSYEQAIVIMEEIGERQGELVSRFNLGTIYIQTENYPKAASNLEKALSLAKELGRQEEQININFMLGRCLRFSGDANGADPYLEESAQLCRQLNADETLP